MCLIKTLSDRYDKIERVIWTKNVIYRPSIMYLMGLLKADVVTIADYRTKYDNNVD